MSGIPKRPPSNVWHKLKIALSIFLLPALLINIVFWIFYSQEIKTKKNILETHAVNMTDMQSVKIGSNFSLIVSDLMFFAGYNQLLDALENAESDKMRLIGDFALFSRGSKIYDQIRFIDTTGMEIIRIDFSKRGPVIVPEDRLQFKGDRYYFKDTFEIEKGEVFVSPFDLNIERGVIEKPLKPMIRFGAPVFDRQGQKRGIVVFNYLGANLIRDIKDITVDSPGFYMLLNAGGYWIIGGDAGDEWGFMYEDGKDRTIKNTYPAAWEKISAIESGQFYDTEGLFTFKTVYPLFEGWKSSTGAGEAFAPSEKIKEAKEYYWKVVSYIPKDILIERRGKSLGKYVYISVMIVLLLGTGSWLLASAKVTHDTAEWELAKHTGELEQANIKLKDLDQLKSMFIASMSHELRTPLNSIMGFTGIILQGYSGEISRESREEMQIVYDSSKHLLNLINDVIDISKIEAEQIDVYFEKIMPYDLLKEAVTAVSKEAEGKKIGIRVDSPEGLCITTDRRRLLQCVLNLLSNAVKYSEGGAVRISARLSTSDGDFLEISVSDTGIGIKEDDIPKLFNSFVRLDSPLKEKTSGTGLGLYLTNKIMKSVFNGNIKVESRYGEGSTFTLIIPLEEGEIKEMES